MDNVAVLVINFVVNINNNDFILWQIFCFVLFISFSFLI